jgi:MFS family permease
MRSGKAPELRGSAEALSTVTGIVDGTGSVGAALGQILVPLIQDWFSWKAVFYMFILMVPHALVFHSFDQCFLCRCSVLVFASLRFYIKRSPNEEMWATDKLALTMMLSLAY